MDDEKVDVTIDLSDDQIEFIELVAKEHGISRDEALEMILKDYIEEKKKSEV